MIYLLEDDESIRKLVSYTLEQAGYPVQGFERPSELWRALEQEQPELVLLDIMLPEEDGLTVLRRLRAGLARKRLPVIMMTAKNAEYDRVIGLDSGADDYISKPFGMMELLARVRAVLRRTELSAQSREYRVGELYLCPERHIVRVSGRDVELTHKEFDLMTVFLENPGVVMSRDTLMDKVWGGNFTGETRTVDVHIRSLRVKLGSGADCIQTVRGVGYKLEEQL